MAKNSTATEEPAQTMNIWQKIVRASCEACKSTYIIYWKDTVVYIYAISI